MGIIVFGIVGALFVGKIANIDGLEAEINQARNPSMYVLCVCARKALVCELEGSRQLQL